MMRAWLQVLMVVFMAASITACGNKGKLKSPTQIQLQEEKKARKAAGKEVPAAKDEKAATEKENGFGSKTGVIVTPSNDVAR